MTVLFDISEPVIMALVSRFEERLPNAIDEINAQATDGLVLAQVDRVFDYIPARGELVSYPTIGVMEGEAELQDDVGWGATIVMPVVAICFVQAVTQRDLVRSLRRYAKAMCNVALEGRTLGPAWGVTLDGVRPGPSQNDEENPRAWESWVGVALLCKAEADSL
jgi:hypothetical protein